MASETVQSSESTESEKWYSPRFGSDPMFSPITEFLTDVSTTDRILIGVYFVMSIAAAVYLQVYFYHGDMTLEEFVDGHFTCEATATYEAAFNFVDIAILTIFLYFFLFTDFWKMGFSIYLPILFVIWLVFMPMAIVFPFYFGLRVSRQAKINANTPINPDVKWYLWVPNWILLFIYFIIYYFAPSPFSDPGVCQP